MTQAASMVCIGGANVDRRLHLLGAPQLGSSNPVQGRESWGGVASNLARSFAAWGLPVRLIASVGDDPTGAALIEAHTRLGIDMQGMRISKEWPTGSYTAALRPDGELWMGLAHMEAMRGLTATHVRQALQIEGPKPLALVLDLNVSKTVAAATLAWARRHRVPMAVVAVSEAKMRHLPDDLRGVHLLTMNLGELEAVAGQRLRNQAARAKVMGALQARHAAHVVVTLGAKGAMCTSAQGVVVVPNPPLDRMARAKAKDVTGAGDLFTARLCMDCLLPARVKVGPKASILGPGLDTLAALPTALSLAQRHILQS